MGFLDKFLSQLPGYGGWLGDQLPKNLQKKEGPSYWYDAGAAQAGGDKATRYGNYQQPDWLRRAGEQIGGEANWFFAQDQAGRTSNVGSNYLLPLRGANAAGGALAFSNLLSMLSNQGRTDPRAMNRTLSGIQRNTQGAQTQMQGNLQSRGFQNAGVGAALQAAIGQAGAGQQAGVVADEAQKAEERRRADLDLFQRIIGQPSMDAQALAMNQYNSNRAAEQQKQGQQSQALGALAQALGSYFGGK